MNSNPPIPASLAPFLQEYNLAQINPQTAAPLLIERTLQYGNRSELHWLFTQFSRTQITAWVQRFGAERLPHPHLAFWRLILEITP
ncbi:MAG: hypothetical protein OHK0052_10900 [Anaerolineales bacterium]